MPSSPVTTTATGPSYHVLPVPSVAEAAEPGSIAADADGAVESIDASRAVTSPNGKSRLMMWCTPSPPIATGPVYGWNAPPSRLYWIDAPAGPVIVAVTVPW